LHRFYAKASCRVELIFASRAAQLKQGSVVEMTKQNDLRPHSLKRNVRWHNIGYAIAFTLVSPYALFLALTVFGVSFSISMLLSGVMIPSTILYVAWLAVRPIFGFCGALKPMRMLAIKVGFLCPPPAMPTNNVPWDALPKSMQDEVMARADYETETFKDFVIGFKCIIIDVWKRKPHDEFVVVFLKRLCMITGLLGAIAGFLLVVYFYVSIFFPNSDWGFHKVMRAPQASQSE
jgi:hypothetical protein